MRGRKPRPTHLRVLDGTRGKIPADRNQPKPHGDLFEPPADLIPQAIPFWTEAIADAPRGLLKRLDKRALAIWATAAYMHADAAGKVSRSGTIVQSQATGAVYQHPALSIMNRQALIMLRAAAELGFTPSARTRIHVTREGDDGNPFSEFA
jgi:P27 family predicted phage terminase small subunit